MRILVVDDEQPALEGLLGTLKKVCSADSEWNEAEICGFRDPLEALCSAEKVNYDIAFLDIEMHKLNGISLAQKLKSLSPYINIIFTTGYSEYGMGCVQTSCERIYHKACDSRESQKRT